MPISPVNSYDFFQVEEAKNGVYKNVWSKKVAPGLDKKKKKKQLHNKSDLQVIQAVL